jgi:hypothetical protein
LRAKVDNAGSSMQTAGPQRSNIASSLLCFVPSLF